MSLTRRISSVNGNAPKRASANRFRNILLPTLSNIFAYIHVIDNLLKREYSPGCSLIQPGGRASCIKFASFQLFSFNVSCDPQNFPSLWARISVSHGLHGVDKARLGVESDYKVFFPVAKRNKQ